MTYTLPAFVKLLQFAFVVFVLVGLLINNKPDNHKGA